MGHELQSFPAELTACLSELTALKDLAIVGGRHTFFGSRFAILRHNNILA